VQVLRSVIFVPGIRENMVEKAAGLAADVICLDLEDSVPLAEKARARERSCVPQSTRWSPPAKPSTCA